MAHPRPDLQVPAPSDCARRTDGYIARMVARTNLVWLLFSLAFMSGEARAAADWYDARGGRAPDGDRIYVCHGYSCRIVTPLTLSAADIQAIAAPLGAGAADAAAERAALSRAVQIFETLVGARIGTSADLPATQVGRSRPDQTDCIDEATNTTSVLRVLKQHGYLKHHRVLQPSSRGFFLDGRYPHSTAVISETGGAKWAVDSWPRANGEAPVIEPLSKWRKGRGGALDS
jgi:hypothetical protein